jgi:hypothetical protein
MVTRRSKVSSKAITSKARPGAGRVAGGRVAGAGGVAGIGGRPVRGVVGGKRLGQDPDGVGLTPPAVETVRRTPYARDTWEGDGLGGGGGYMGGGFMLGQGRGLSPIVDVLRGLGDESAGIFARNPRRLLDTELAAIGQDGIGRRVVTIKVEQALAPGYCIDMVGLDPTVAQEVVAEATKVFRRINGASHIKAAGISAQWYGKAALFSTYKWDRGLADLSVPLSELLLTGGVGEVCGGIRWMSSWDRRDYQVRELANSRSVHYRQGEGATWLDLYPIHPPLEYDRLYGGVGQRGQDPSMVRVHPSRYLQLTTVSGYSIFQECALYIANLLSAASGGASLMQRAAAGVMTLKDWEAQALSGGDEARQKLQAQYEALSHLNLMFLDQGETFQWADLSTSGIEQGIYAIAYLLSAATGIPMTILLGASPGAFESGDAQIQQWHLELDNTRSWLEPLIRWVWDQCIAEVTGGLVGEYNIVWNPYTVPTADDMMKTQGAALDLGLKAMEAGLLSRDAVIAGLSKTGALGFDFGAALAAGAVARAAAANGGTGAANGAVPAAPMDPALFTTLLGALTAYYGETGVPRESLALLIAAVAPSMQPGMEKLLQDKAAIAAAAMATAAQNAAGAVPGAPIVAGAGGGTDAPVMPIKAEPLPGEAMTPEDIAVENWVPAGEVGELFALSPGSLKSLRTAVPGVHPGPGEIAWLQNPASGHARYMRSGLAKVMIGGRAALQTAGMAAAQVGDLSSDTLAECWQGLARAQVRAADLPMEGWPADGIAWRMVRQSDETGVSGTGEVVRGRVMRDGTLLSWWMVEGMPPRPHVDKAWAPFHDVHIGQHPSNGTLIEQQTTDGTWVAVADVARGPGPWADPGHVCWPGDGCVSVALASGSDVDPNRVGKVGLQVAEVTGVKVHGHGVPQTSRGFAGIDNGDGAGPGGGGTRVVSGEGAKED